MSSPRLGSSSIVSLDQLTPANVAELRHAGFAVPDGVVITGDGEVDLQAVAAVLGQGPLAVRSSPAAEDLVHPGVDLAGDELAHAQSGLPW